MRHIAIGFSFLSLLAGAACGGEPAAASDPLAGVLLDAGKRWPADDHTRRSAQAMLDAVRAVPATADAEATKALGDRLQGLLEQLISGCTMQGPAHDALHIYLAALMPRVEAMHGTDSAAAARAFGEVSRILGRFGEFFV